MKSLHDQEFTDIIIYLATGCQDCHNYRRGVSVQCTCTWPPGDSVQAKCAAFPAHLPHFLASATPRLTIPPIARAAAPPTIAMPTRPSATYKKRGCNKFALKILAQTDPMNFVVLIFSVYNKFGHTRQFYLEDMT